jgi:hypothetical protein
MNQRTKQIRKKNLKIIKKTKRYKIKRGGFKIGSNIKLGISDTWVLHP